MDISDPSSGPGRPSAELMKQREMGDDPNEAQTDLSLSSWNTSQPAPGPTTAPSTAGEPEAAVVPSDPTADHSAHEGARQPVAPLDDAGGGVSATFDDPLGSAVLTDNPARVENSAAGHESKLAI